ncbi:MAG: hypothetical protein AB1782_16735 [Cyanobacteriota bacterium]
MSKNLKQLIIFVLISLITFSTNNSNKLIAVKKNDNLSKINTSVDNTYQDLENSPQWKELGLFWKKLNHIEKKKDFIEKQLYFESLQKDYSLLTSLLNTLKKEDLLTEDQKDYIYKSFKDRVLFLKAHWGVITCYQITPQDSLVYENRVNLEKRYDIIEKLYLENKITKSSYELSKIAITKDLMIINNKDTDTSHIKKVRDFSELIFLLNK